MTFQKPPRILTVQFLRFTYTGRKIDKFIKFPKCFNLRAFVSDNIDGNLPRDQHTDHIYDLYGVVIHSGRSTRSGHYYSYVKKQNRWFCCNDESVREINNLDQVLKQKAYLLFYKRRTVKPKVEVAKPKPQQQQQQVKSSLEFPALAMAKTKSISVEIKETHANKNQNHMPLAGFMETPNEVNSDEEDEKLGKYLS